MAKKVLSEAQLTVLEMGSILRSLGSAKAQIEYLQQKRVPHSLTNVAIEALPYIEEAIENVRAWNIQRHKKLVSP